MGKRIRKPGSLSSNRPRVTNGGRARLSAKAGRKIIRSHHQLSKALKDAQNAGDINKAEEVKEQIEAQGGLSSYQHASLLGQSDERGGDSSKVLMDWIKCRVHNGNGLLRILEVGALSTSNAISKSRFTHVTRIDVNSQTPGILEQDFMDRPIPESSEDRFDIVSLSLVLNFVATREDRGRMLKRTCEFLDVSRQSAGSESQSCLFLVLPAPCITNSRYIDEERLTRIMSSIGYHPLHRKLSSKLIYYLWEYRPELVDSNRHFDKMEVNPGRDRNNFSIVT